MRAKPPEMKERGSHFECSKNPHFADYYSELGAKSMQV